MSWMIEHEFSYGWDDAGWMGEDGPERFKTRLAAGRALEEHLECCESAYRRGDLSSKEDRNAYRIAKDKTNMKTKQLTIIGTNHGKKLSRIWIEGKRLIEAGFEVGKTYDRDIDLVNGVITLRLNEMGDYKVSGKGDKPIIDTSGKVVRDVFPDTGDDTAKQVVEVTYEPGVITIQRPKEVSK